MSEAMDIILPATWETIYMIVITSFFTVLLGMPLAIILYITREGGLSPKPKIYAVLDFIVNIIRSFPFIILMIVVLPLASVIVGTKMGTKASIVALIIGAVPFFARLVEQEFLNIDSGIIEASRSMGADNKSIIFDVLIPEAMPQLVLILVNLVITLVGYSAMAGVIGGGGLGAVAKRYGYDRYRNDILFISVIFIIVIVQLVQYLGTKISIKINKKNI
ncbi:MAG: methionine ABC transporter permease [Finegoldia sp.]|nr:methionine ABC transporter permease [Finegoldia sp.]